ncbi:MAG: ABC transporter substrate-binding protein [Solirubrobacteraceae bacterium]
MTQTSMSRRQMLGVMGVAALGLAGCGSVGEEEESGESGTDAIKVGLVIPQAGVYAPLGVDMKAAWDLWLAENGNRIGGREVQVVIADEGEGPDTGLPAIQRLVQRDQVDALVGIVNSAVALGAKDIVAGAKRLLIVANAGADQLTAGDVPYVWRSSFTNGQVGYAVGQYLAQAEEGRDGAYAVAADYAAGAEAIAGFRAGMEANGGEIVDEAGTPFGTTQDFQPFLSRIRRSGAGAVYCFYAGAEAVAFVKQYREFGLSDRIPLFGSGFLTEGGVLEAQGAAAEGVRTALHYTPQIENEANQAFVEAYEAKVGSPPTTYAMQTWDAAALLDRAVTDAEALDGDTLAQRMEGLGEIADSPRGPWRFEERSPHQKMYLREVRSEGGGFINAIVEDLGEFSPAPAAA